LNKNEKRLIEPMLQKYAHVLHDEEPNDFKSTNVVEHIIDRPDAYKTPRV
jgi:hypothetical protein